MAAVAAKLSPDVPPRNFAVLCAVNALFTTLALADYSVDLFALQSISIEDSGDALTHEGRARMTFLSVYYTWRDEAPIIAAAVQLLISPLPLVLYTLFRDSAGWLLGFRSASNMRHAADVAQLLTLTCVIIPTVALRQWPFVDALKSACSADALGRWFSGAADVGCIAAAQQVVPVHLLLVGTNIIMTVTDCMKWAGNRDNFDRKPRAD